MKASILFAIIGFLLLIGSGVIDNLPNKEMLFKKWPSIRWVTYSFSIILLLVSGYSQFIQPLLISSNDVFVTPKTFNMHAGQNRKFIMKITNNKDIPIYGVQVSFCIDEGDFLTDDIQVEAIDEAAITGELGDNDGKVIVSFDGMKIHSLSKRNGEMVSINMMMQIDNISAHSTRDYMVNIKGIQRAKRSTLKIQISAYSKEPNPIAEGRLPISPEDVHYQRGNNLTDQHKYLEAIASYKEAYRLNPNSAKVINNWGIALFYLGKNDEAVDKYKEAINVNKSFSPAYYNLGVFYFENNKYEKAIEEFEKAISIDPKHLDSYFLCAKAYEKIKKYKKALAMYGDFINLGPKEKQKQEAQGAIKNIKTQYILN
jgi:Flp pilus assembly protein TadD